MSLHRDSGHFAFMVEKGKLESTQKELAGKDIEHSEEEMKGKGSSFYHS